MLSVVNEKELLYTQAYKWLLDHGPKIITGIIVLLIGLWVVKLISRWLHRSMHKREVDPSLKPFLVSVVLVVLRVLLFISVMQIIGIEMTIFVTVLGAFSVAIGLALSGTLQNFASGVLILILKPFKIGDNIVAQGQEGTVTSIQIFYTIVTTFDNRTVVVPNSKLSNEVIINISTIGSRRLDVELKMAYKADYEKINEVIRATIAATSNMLKKPESRIGISVFADPVYTILISVWVKAHGFNDTRLKFQELLLKNAKAAGIIPGV